MRELQDKDLKKIKEIFGIRLATFLVAYIILLRWSLVSLTGQILYLFLFYRPGIDWMETRYD